MSRAGAIDGRLSYGDYHAARARCRGQQPTATKIPLPALTAKPSTPAPATLAAPSLAAGGADGHGTRFQPYSGRMRSPWR